MDLFISALIVAFLVWAVTYLMGKFPVPQPIAAVLYVGLVALVLYWIVTRAIPFVLRYF